MKKCAQCHGKLGLGVRSRNLWNGRWWIHVRFCSSRCEARHELKRALACQALAVSADRHCDAPQCSTGRERGSHGSEALPVAGSAAAILLALPTTALTRTIANVDFGAAARDDFCS